MSEPKTAEVKGLIHGPLSGQDLSQMTAASVLLYDGRDIVRIGEHGVSVDSATVAVEAGEPFAYIGERGPDGVIKAPVGGWPTDLFSDLRGVSVRYRGHEMSQTHNAQDVDWSEVVAFSLITPASPPAETGEGYELEALARELAEERQANDEEAHGVCGTTEYEGTVEDFLPDAREFVGRCRAAQPVSPSEGEAVAWRFRHRDQRDVYWAYVDQKPGSLLGRDEYEIQPLYAHPASDQSDTERLRDELAWYGEQARLARLIHSEGDAGRAALAADGGKRAAAALAEKAADKSAANGEA